MILSLMVAYAKNKAIGKDNQLLWHLSDDLKNFKRVTTGRPIIMGRKTFESIGRALPGRLNIVISRNSDLYIENVEVVHSTEEAVELAKKAGATEAVIIGGGELYKCVLDRVSRMYITEVDCELEADTFFPEWNESGWKLSESFTHRQDEKNEHTWTFKVFDRL